MSQQVVLQKIADLAKQDKNIAVVWLYGSRAKGLAGPESDFDLAVAFNHFPDDSWEKRLQPELLAQQWSDALGVDDGVISVVDINHIPLPLAMAVMQADHPIQVNDSLRMVREENRIASMWELDHQYHRKHYG